LSKSHGGLFNHQFLTLLFALAVIAGSLFMIFTLVATSTVSETTGVILFLLTTGLLMAGYMLGFMALAFVAVLLLMRYWIRSAKS